MIAAVLLIAADLELEMGLSHCCNLYFPQDHQYQSQFEHLKDHYCKHQYTLRRAILYVIYSMDHTIRPILYTIQYSPYYVGHIIWTIFRIITLPWMMTSSSLWLKSFIQAGSTIEVNPSLKAAQ